MGRTMSEIAAELDNAIGDQQDAIFAIDQAQKEWDRARGLLAQVTARIRELKTEYERTMNVLLGGPLTTGVPTPAIDAPTNGLSHTRTVTGMSGDV